MTEVPIKVLQLLISMPVGGAENMVSALATCLAPREFQVTVACIGAPGPMGEELKRSGCRVISLGLDIKYASKFLIIRRLRDLLRELRPEILHTHLYHPNLYGRIASLGMGLKGRVATVHNVYKRVKMHRRLMNWLLGQVSDCVVVFSPEVAKDVLHYDRIAPSRLRLLSPGVRVEERSVRESREAARERLGIKGFCIGTVARLEEQKGHEYLLEAISQVRSEIADLAVVIVGDGPRRSQMEEQAASLGVSGCVRFLGTRRDVPLILRGLDLYVQPSLWEGIPLTLLEAMGAGVPAISTRVGRAPEVIQDGENGRLVPPGDADALAAAILDAYRHPEWRRRWKELGEFTIREKYSLDRMLRQFADIYLDIYQKGQLR
jgi:glycosyltransferase involved in cell wall biosynthesis